MHLLSFAYFWETTQFAHSLRNGMLYSDGCSVAEVGSCTKTRSRISQSLAQSAVTSSPEWVMFDVTAVGNL